MAQGETPRRRSPDGRWEWDGTSWVPAGQQELGAAPGRPRAGDASPAGARGGGFSRRVLLAAVLAGLLALAGSGTGAFLVAGSLAGGSGGGVACSDGSSLRCLPVKLDAVVKVLESNGYSCKSDRSSPSCDLAVGVTGYSVIMESPSTGGSGGVNLESFLLDVSFPKGSQPGKGAMACLKWFASIPFAGDKATAAATTSWLTREVNGHANQKATINGYRYQIDASRPGFIRLEAQGGLS